MTRLFAIVLLFCAGAAMSAEVGRLFFTPAQRAALDEARKKNMRGEVVVENKKLAPLPQNVSVNGVVRRSDGKSTIWINNQPVTDRQPAGIRVAPAPNDNRVKLTVPESGRTVDLKVGQTVEIVSGSIEEGYARRAAPKPAATPASGAETGTPDAQKAAAPPAPLTAKPETTVLKRYPRTRESDTQDDARSGGGPERK